MDDEKNCSIVYLTYFQGTGSIWNVKEWKKLRQHRIVGNFVGILASNPHQVNDKGFPLILTKNEVTLLLEKGFAVLRECQSLIEAPDDSIREQSQKQREHSFKTQVELLKEERKLEILEKADTIVKGKLAKRQKIDSNYTANEEDRDAIIKEELSRVTDPTERLLYVQTCTEDPWTSRQHWKPVPWNYPTTDTEKLEYATFRALWETGRWVTPGGKFGGNFLAYPGDPLLYHAHLIIKYIKKDEALNPVELVTCSRLANSTRKTFVFAYFDTRNEICFRSLSWLNE